MTNQIALIIIDVQKAFQLPDWGERNNIFAEENMRILLEEWRKGNDQFSYSTCK